jgi:hypothetical protein
MIVFAALVFLPGIWLVTISNINPNQIGQTITLPVRPHADQERILGPDHPGTLDSRNNLAEAYRYASGAAAAIPLHERTLADRERVLGPGHPSTVTVRYNLATAQASQR